MLINSEKSAVLLFLISLLFAIAGCSSVDNNNSASEKILEAPRTNQCMWGFISPPGVNDCFRIADILAGNNKFKAPNGRCPANWQKHNLSGFCLPAYHLVSCGTFTFACNSEKGDTFRIVRGEPTCKDGSIMVTAPAPEVDHDSGLYLGTKTVLACWPPPSKQGPIGKHDPVPN